MNKISRIDSRTENPCVAGSIPADATSPVLIGEIGLFCCTWEIAKAVDRSNKPTTDDTKGGFHEEGGIFGTAADGSEMVIHAKPGSYSNPKVEDKATVNVFTPADPAQQGAVTSVQGTFHIHPGGSIVEYTSTLPPPTPGVVSSGGTSSTQTWGFEQTPSGFSGGDVDLATQGGNTSGYNIVVGAGNSTVYIFGTAAQNKPGKTYRASFPLDKFISIGNEKKKTP